jgi:hypothetical protein
MAFGSDSNLYVANQSGNNLVYRLDGNTGAIIDTFSNFGGAHSIAFADVPEPGTMALAGFAAAGLLSSRRRRCKRVLVSRVHCRGAAAPNAGRRNAHRIQRQAVNDSAITPPLRSSR